MNVDQNTPKKPPVGELVLSLQFEQLTKLNSGYFGRLWSEVFPEMRCDSDAEPIEDQFEDIGGPMRLNRGFAIGPASYPGRMILSSPGGDRLCQIQRTRFVHNWRSAGSDYPEYDVFLNEFLLGLDKFKSFVDRYELGPIVSNQWELVYVDIFPENDDWKDLEDWSTVLPGLFSSLNVANGLKLCNRNAAWSFELEDGIGRMHISANLGLVSGQKSATKALMVNTTVRGPLQGWNPVELSKRLDYAHKIATGSFKKFVSPSILMRCK